jgi:perosamine synthetase
VRIPVAAPTFVGNEKKYVMDCLDSTWVSSNGAYLPRFEAAFAAFCSARFAVACCNGSAALHLALMALGVGPGDEILVPTLTFVATANAVTYCGARPVFVDSEPRTWNLDPEQLSLHLTPRTKGVIAVHLYGHPVDMDPVMALCREKGLFLIEDAAEAHGAEYRGRRVGSFGDLACFSFYGNKVLTTGEGGMVVTNSETLARRVRLLRGQGQDPERRYWFPMVGYNYRMTNIEAAIGLAQLECVSWHLSRRREVAAWYREMLTGINALTLSPEMPWARSSFWMASVVLANDHPLDRDAVMAALAAKSIETRPFFYPMHTLPMYRDLADGSTFPVAENLAASGFNLPSSASLKREEVAEVCKELWDLVG